MSVCVYSMLSYTIHPIVMKLCSVVVCMPVKVSDLVQPFYNRWWASLLTTGFASECYKPILTLLK